jgi:dolichol-phosphate mannosyltransferase
LRILYLGYAAMPAAWLVLPTYNEAENLEAIVGAVLPRLAEAAAAHPEAAGDHRLLVVDDSSPDGTGRIADRLAAEHEAVEVLHRPGKEGLGRAYLAGFERALGSGAVLVLEMDADFSHDPADLPRLVAATQDADLVLGSRYVEGGGVTDWGVLRRLLSRGGSWYARTVLDVPVRDLTGGFKCFRADGLSRLGLDEVGTDGYGFQIELTYRAVRAGLRVREVPILFRDRAAGTSKMNARIALEAVWKVPALRVGMR